MRIAEFKPQVFSTLVLLSVLGVVCLAFGQPELAGVCVGGVVMIGKNLVEKRD